MKSSSTLHSHTKKRLKLLSSTDSGCFIFVGQEFVGKRTTAYGVARDLTENLSEYQIIITADNQHKPTIKFAQINQLIHDLSLAPLQLNQKRVVIIEYADRMNQEAANALLKILEEPPAFTSFILIAETTSTILPTIISRASVIRFLADGDFTSKIDSVEILPKRILDTIGDRPALYKKLSSNPDEQEKYQMIVDLASEYERGDLTQKFLVAKKIHDMPQLQKEFINQLYYLYNQPSKIDLLNQLIKLEGGLRHNLNIRMVLEWFALGIVK